MVNGGIGGDLEHMRGLSFLLLFFNAWSQLHAASHISCVRMRSVTSSLTTMLLL